MKNTEQNPTIRRSAWEPPVLHAIDIDLTDVATGMNLGTDAANGRTSSAS